MSDLHLDLEALFSSSAIFKIAKLLQHKQIEIDRNDIQTFESLLTVCFEVASLCQNFFFASRPQV